MIGDKAPVYIITVRNKDVFIPAMLGVIEDCGTYRIGYKKINGSVLEIFEYHPMAGKVFDSEASAQAALDEVASIMRWKPYQKLRSGQSHNSRCCCIKG